MRRFTVPPFSLTRGASRPPTRRESGETSGLCQIGVLRLRQPRELRARADAELPVDAGQGGGHRVLGEKQGSSDFAVRAALSDERGDPAFCRRQALDPRAASDRPQLAAGPLRPPGRPERLKALESRGDRLPGGAFLARSPPNGSECQERPRASERVANGLVLYDRSLELSQRVVEVAASGREEAEQLKGRLGEAGFADEPSPDGGDEITQEPLAGEEGFLRCSSGLTSFDR